MSKECFESEANFQKLWDSKFATEITEKLYCSYGDDTGINHLDGNNMPQREAIIEVLELISEVIFPGYSGKHHFDRIGVRFSVGAHLNIIYRELYEQVKRAFAYRCRKECCNCDAPKAADKAVVNLLDKLPELRETLKLDVKAAIEGDPATDSADEVVIAYPGVRAITIHRIAHELYQAAVPLIPRVMSEFAHALTGIDINPGAQIGPSFFIDHGTGVVVGETAIIGKNVKLYQGVTLGALSFPKDACGKLIKGKKRHPNLEDDVTIYSGATILGDITIGRGSVIGGNVWLTESVPPFSKVTIAAPQLSIRQKTANG